MIVTDNTPKTPLKTPAQPVSGESSGPPPSYGASVQHPTEQAFYQYVQVRPNHQQSALKRFFKAFFVALLVWILFSILVRSIIEVGYGPGGGWSDDFPIPRDIALGHCVDSHWSVESLPTTYPYHAHSSFDLPISSETLLFLSRGSRQSGGSIEFHTSPNITDMAKINVTARYYRESALSHTKVCQIQRKPGENGVGFFTPRDWWGRKNVYEQVYFDVKVLLPETSSPPLQMNNLETDLPNFRHNLTYTENLVEYKTFSLETSNSPIFAKGLHALRAGSVRTSNAPIFVQSFSVPNGAIRTSNSIIEGVYNASDSLTLRTSNAPIKVTVNLHNEKGSTSNLVVRTSNNLIDNKINLLSSSSSNAQFKVSTTTSNGVLRDNVASLPVDATLNYDGRTSNSRAELYLPPPFEGQFGLTTSNNKLSLLYDEDVKDPAGRNRQRTVHQTANKAGFLEGHVYWDKKNKDGHATVRTSNGPVTLHL